jgi:quinol monooxygenase YgiN
MLIVRFKVRCEPDFTERMSDALRGIVGAARNLPGVVHFDVARDVTDANAFIATEVFEDRTAMEREEALPEVAKVIELMQSGALAAPPEWTIYEIASSESPSLG